MPGTSVITIQVSVSKGWLHNEGGFTFPEKYYFDPLYRWNQDRAADDFVKSRFPKLPVYNMESNLVQAEYFDPNQVLVGGIQPNLLLGMAVGAQLRCYEDKDPDIDGKPLEHAGSARDLPDPASLMESEIMRLLNSQVGTIRRERPDLNPIPPFFLGLLRQSNDSWIDHNGSKAVRRKCIYPDEDRSERVCRNTLMDYRGIQHYDTAFCVPRGSAHFVGSCGRMLGIDDKRK